MKTNKEKLQETIKLEKYGFYIMMPIFMCMIIVLLILNRMDQNLFLKWHYISFIIYIFELYLMILSNHEIGILEDISYDKFCNNKVESLTSKDFAIDKLSIVVANSIIVFVDIICIELPVCSIGSEKYIFGRSVLMTTIYVIVAVQFIIAQNLVDKYNK